MRHPRHLIITVLAVLALVVTACAEDDPDASGSLDGEPTGSAGISLGIGSAEPSPSETAEESEEPSEDASFGDDDETASPSFGDDDESASPDESPDASASDDDDGLTAGCQSAFEDVPDLSRIDSLMELQEVLDALDETIEACESVSAWTDEAQERLNLANVDIDARDFLERQCERPDLEDAPLCEAL